MLGGSCHPCCPQPQGWYCYDFRACGCHTNELRPSVVNMQGGPQPRYIRMLFDWQLTQPSYGRFTINNNPQAYLTKYEQSSFYEAFEGDSEGGFFAYSGDAGWPGPRRMQYLRYVSGYDPLCFETSESCQYTWLGENLGQAVVGTGATQEWRSDQEASDFGGVSPLFYQRLTVNISCVRTGFSPTVDMEYVVQPGNSAAATPAEANAAGANNILSWGPRAPQAGWIRGIGRNFTNLDTLMGVPGFTFEQAFPIITRWPPQPDISAATITRVDEGVTSQFRCFYWDFQITYPLKKWSLLPNDITQAELLTVGTLRLRFGDTNLGSF